MNAQKSLFSEIQTSKAFIQVSFKKFNKFKVVEFEQGKDSILVSKS